MSINDLLDYIGKNGVVGVITLFIVSGIIMYFFIAKEFFKNRELDRKMYENDLEERIETRKAQRDLSESIRENTKQYKLVSNVLLQSQDQRNKIEQTGTEIKRLVEKLKSDNELSNDEIKKLILRLVREITELKEELYYLDFMGEDKDD